jgi:Domain of unknown function (DUF4407)
MLLWLSAIDPSVLAQCPTERRKFVATGGIVLTAASIAVLAAVFTLRDFLLVPSAAAIIIGLCWGVVIMNIDRWLLVSIRRQRTPQLTLIMAIPRLFLAVIVGLVVAQPLVLTVFRSEINHQVSRDKREELSNDKQHLKEQYSAVQALRSEKTTLQREVTEGATGKSLVKDPRYRELNASLNVLERQERVAEDNATCELDGTCGTRHAGHGPAYERKRGVAAHTAQRVEEVKNQREALAGEVTGQERGAAREQRHLASPQLTKVDDELNRLEQEKLSAEQQYVHESKAKPGLLDRIEALARLSQKRSSLKVAELLLWLLILAIDAMPAFAKTIMSLGRPSLYEQVLDEVERDALAAAESKREANKRTYALQTATQIRASEVRRDFELGARAELTKKMVNTQKKAAEAYVDAWEAAVVPIAEKWANDWANEFKEAAEQRGPSMSKENGYQQPQAR